MTISDAQVGDPGGDPMLAVLRHPALRPWLEEVMDARRRRGTLEPAGLGEELRGKVEEALEQVSTEDWHVAALCLIEEEAGGAAGGPPEISGPPDGEVGWAV